MPLASARQHPENEKENQAGHSPERTVEGQHNNNTGKYTPKKLRRKCANMPTSTHQVTGYSFPNYYFAFLVVLFVNGTTSKFLQLEKTTRPFLAAPSKNLLKDFRRLCKAAYRGGNNYANRAKKPPFNLAAVFLRNTFFDCFLR